jgi:hypothetical protein
MTRTLFLSAGVALSLAFPAQAQQSAIHRGVIHVSDATRKKKPSRKKEAPPVDEALERNLMFARRTRFGNSPDLATRDQSIAYLLQHEAAAYPRLLSDLRAGVDRVGTLGVIALFRRAETVPVLEELLQNAPRELKRHVGVALGQHPQVEARTALTRALRSNDRDLRMAAVDGLGASRDPSVASLLRAELGSDDAELRWLTVNALVALCALSDDELARLASTDPDENVRALADKKRKANCGQ